MFAFTDNEPFTVSDEPDAPSPHAVVRSLPPLGQCALAQQVAQAENDALDRAVTSDLYVSLYMLVCPSLNEECCVRAPFGLTFRSPHGEVACNGIGSLFAFDPRILMRPASGPLAGAIELRRRPPNPIETKA
jgi:hypothetical protein